MTTDAFPSEPIDALEAVGTTMEQFQDDILARLGSISVTGATQEALDWAGDIADAANRISLLCDDIFSAVNAITPDLVTVAPVPEAISESLTPAKPEVEPLTPLLREFLVFAVGHPGFKISDVRTAGNGFSRFRSDDLTRTRKELARALKQRGVDAEWTGQYATQKRKHTIVVHGGHEIVKLLIADPTEVQDEVTTEDSVMVPIEEPPVPSRIVVEARVPVDVPAPPSSDFEDMAEAITSTLADGPQSISGMIRHIYGVNHLDRVVFYHFMQELKAALARGEVRELDRGMYEHVSCGEGASPKGSAPAEVTQSPQNDLDDLIRQLRRASGLHPQLNRKPHQRGRRRGR